MSNQPANQTTNQATTNQGAGNQATANQSRENQGGARLALKDLRFLLEEGLGSKQIA